MSWIKDGQRVYGNYHGHPVQGIVESSRVKYGGKVQYTVNLDTPVQMPWRSELTTRVLLDHTELNGEAV